MKILSSETLAKGSFLELSRLEYMDDNGIKRKWEAVGRINSAGAVLLIAVTKPDSKLILIRQYRPPTAMSVIEFPAGLIDPGETPEQAAVRELREETGCTGTVISCSKAAYNSPGLTSEYIYLVRMSVDMDSQGELVTDFDESESIETFFVPQEKLADFLEHATKNGDAVDSKLLTYSTAINNNGK